MTLCLVICGCDRHAAPVLPPVNKTQPTTPGTPMFASNSLKLALVPEAGDGHTDREIRRYQELVRSGKNREMSVEKLGWLFITKARESFDPGYYKLADACADVLGTDKPRCNESLLLHGYVLENLHRFKEAEPLARELATQRGLPFDFGLLGDSLMEQGRLAEAVTNYQSMVNLRPDLESYSRIAHIRWLTGDLAGAIEMMQLAVSAGSPRDPNSSAWVNTKLAALLFQSGKTDAAESAVATALMMASNYPPALLLRGRMALAQNQTDVALENLLSAEQANPLPEYQWALAEALRSAGRLTEAEQMESRLQTSGTANDPRTLSLFLSTRDQANLTALRLAEAELLQRQDIFTEDALAWALAATGRIAEANAHMDRALAEGTEDTRLFFHAAVIKQKAGKNDEAQKWFARATGSIQTLLPSEKKQLLHLAETFSTVSETTALAGTKDLSASSATTEK